MEIFLDYLGRSNIITRVLKRGRMAKESQRQGYDCEQRQRCYAAGFKAGGRGPQSKEHGQLPWLEKADNEFSHRAPRKDHHPADTLSLAQWDLFCTCDLQRSKVINLWCYQPLHLWYFIIAVIENESSLLEKQLKGKTTLLSNQLPC